MTPQLLYLYVVRILKNNICYVVQLILLYLLKLAFLIHVASLSAGSQPKYVATNALSSLQ